MGFWDYEDVQGKLNPGDTSERDESTPNLTDLEDDKVEETEEVEEEEVEEDTTEEESTEDKAPEKASAAGELTPEQRAALAEQVIGFVGKDATLKVKGVTKKLSELSPEEMTVYLQKGMNAERLYQEQATTRKALERERALVTEAAAQIQRYMQERTGGGTTQPGTVGRGQITELPEYLKPHPDDTVEIQQFKLSQVRMMDELNELKQHVNSTASREADTAKVNEVLSFRETYPMASIDEVLAVKSVRPDVDSEELMRASHNYYAGNDFIKKAIASNPTFKREYDAEVIKSYLAKKGGAPRISGRKTAGSGIDRVSAGKPNKNFGGTFEEADSLSRQYLKEVERMEKG